MCFLNTASSLFHWHNLAQFGIPYFAHWTPVNQDLQKGTIKQPRTIFPLQWHWSCTPYGPVCPVFHQKQLITIANTSTSDTYVCSYSSLFNHVYIKSDWIHASYKMAWSNVLNCAYLDAKLLNSYPPLKLRKWVLMSNYGDSQTWQGSYYHWIEPLSMGYM